MKNRFFFLIFTLLIFPKVKAEEENPFLKMADKEYILYYQEILAEVSKFDYTDSIQAGKTLKYLQEVLSTYNTPRWQLEYNWFHTAFMQHELIFHPERCDYTYEVIIQNFKDIASQAEKENLLYLQARSMNSVVHSYWEFVKNYELAFEYAKKLEKILENIPSESLPRKNFYYLYIANMHYYFKDYELAASIYKKIINEPETPYNTPNILSSFNGLGLCYRYHYNNLDSSDYYFRLIPLVKYNMPDKNYSQTIWRGISNGNLGQNMLIRNKPDEAIDLLLSAIQITTELNDYGYASGAAIGLAKAYLKKGNPVETRKYIELAKRYNQISPRDGRMADIYDITTHYYNKTGDLEKAMVYADSTAYKRKELNEQFNAMKLLRAEQRVHTLEQSLKEDELKAEKIRNDNYRNNLIFISIGLCIVSLLLVLYYLLYIKKRQAYRLLVKRTQEWAENEDRLPLKENEIKAPISNISEREANESDLLIMDKAKHYIIEQKAFLDESLTLDALAKKIGVNRVLLSQAINYTTGNNFNYYLNEFRIKEAIRILSSVDSKNLSIDQIAYDSGFSNRKTFYRVFKNITGISPSDFRKNNIPSEADKSVLK